MGHANVEKFVYYTAGGGDGGGASQMLEWHEYESDTHEVGAQCQADAAHFIKRHDLS